MKLPLELHASNAPVCGRWESVDGQEPILPHGKARLASRPRLARAQISRNRSSTVIKATY